ncbi:DUF6603 domain-containing protein [Micromonospora sp. NPDC126480]|uniref:DUF6603 domain-containing protein n=1 Tax=Micromonospora sp. NPDC126480 TaxID=3155312 RepID=UPI003320BF7D
MSAAGEFAALVAPLTGIGADPARLDALLRDLGMADARQSLPPVPAELVALAGTATDTIEALAALDDPAVPLAERVAGLAASLGGLFAAVDDLRAVPTGDLGAPFDAPRFWSVLAERLPAYLLNRWLAEAHGEIFDLLALAGVVGPGTFDFGRLVEVAGDPGGQFGAVLGADLAVLVEPLRRFVDGRGAGARYGGTVEYEGARAVSGDGAFGDVDGVSARPGPLTVQVVPAVSGRGGLAVSVGGLERAAGGVEIAAGWTLTAAGGEGTAGLVVLADGTEPLDGSTLDSAAVTLAGRPAEPWVLLGSATGTRLELAAAEVALTGEKLGGTPEFAITFATEGLRLVLSPGEADSFLATILGPAEIGASMRLAGRWSPADGLDVDGAAGLEIRIDTSVAVGPVTVNGLTIALLIADGVLTVELTAEVSGTIGPVSAAIAGAGLRLALAPAAQSDGIPLGPVGAVLAVKPPDGVGLGVDAGVAAGGGYLYLDPDQGRYAGVIELRLVEVGISAFVIIDTDAPDVDGWSLFLALFLDIPAIQLGFGFTLTGVGGLAGINRRLDTPALEAAVRSGALDSVLFPADPVAEAPFVIEQLRSMFPPDDGQYVFGPVVKIGWGTPTLIEARIGIVVSLPDPVVVAVLGSVTSVLPTPDLDLVALHLDVAGVVDFAAGTLSVSASLHDSHIACFALSGAMELRADFTEEPSFLLALGGFHPGFEAPPAFPPVDRLRLAIGAPPVLDISFECYFALTSNTVQFGAEFEMTAEVAGFGVAGGTGFDALVSFSPFRVTTRVGYYVSVTAAGFDLMGVWLDATVSGPNPWRVIGDARFTVLGIRESIHIDERIGQTRADPAPPATDPRDEIGAALARPESWAAIAGTSTGVILTDATDDECVALPDGTVEVRQKVAPLGMRLDKVGDAPIGAYHTFNVEPAAGSVNDTGPAHDWFAPGYYVELAGAERLSSPSFEWLPAGVRFGGGDPVAGPARRISLDFEEILRDPELAEDRVDLGVVDRTALVIAGGPGSVRARGFTIAADPDAVTPRRTGYAVTDRVTGDLRARDSSWSRAHQSDAGRRRTTTVVPTWELPS